MKKTLSLLIFILASHSVFSQSVNAKNAYIYDKDKAIWTLAGPSKDFRVEYKYSPGTKLQVIKGQAENGYNQVIDSKGRKSWIISNYLLPSANIHLDKVLDDIEHQKLKHKKKVKSLQSEIAAKASLENINQKLQSQIAAMQLEMEQLKQSYSAVSSRFNREVFFAGGLTVCVGFLFGWVFGIKARKRKDSWN